MSDGARRQTHNSRILQGYKGGQLASSESGDWSEDHTLASLAQQSACEGHLNDLDREMTRRWPSHSIPAERLGFVPRAYNPPAGGSVSSDLVGMGLGSW